MGLLRFLVVAAHERIQKLPPVIHDQPQPVAPLVMLAQLPEQNRLFVPSECVQHPSGLHQAGEKSEDGIGSGAIIRDI